MNEQSDIVIATTGIDNTAINTANGSINTWGEAETGMGAFTFNPSMPNPYATDTVSIVNGGNGTVTCNGQIVTDGATLARYLTEENSCVANPNPGWEATWSECDTIDTPTNTCINNTLGPKSPTVAFSQIPLYTVTVTIQDGDGTMQTSQGECAQPACTYQVLQGDDFTVNSATPNTNKHLEELLGALAGQTLPFTFTNIQSDTDAGGANFDPNINSITENITGEGSVTRTPSDSQVAAGTIIAIEPHPAAGHMVKSASGHDSTDGQTYFMVADQPDGGMKTFSIEFAQIDHEKKSTLLHFMPAILAEKIDSRLETENKSDQK